MAFDFKSKWNFNVADRLATKDDLDNLPSGGVDATGVLAGRAPVADGAGGWEWGEVIAGAAGLDDPIAVLVPDVGTATGAALDATIAAALDGFEGGAAALPPNVVFEGDSQMGTGSVATLSPTAFGDTMPAFVVAGIDPRATLANVANFGAQVSQMDASYATQIEPLFSPGKANVLVLWGGTNDLSLGGATAAAVLASTASLVAKARATGFTVVTGTLLPRTDGSKPVNFDANRATINAALRANADGIYGDYIADPAADTRIGDDADSDDTRYYSDKLHMTARGYSVVADSFRAALAEAGVVVPARPGYNPGAPSVFTAASSLALGYRALELATGNNNTALGYLCLDACTTGTNNTAVGTEALSGLLDGTGNVAVGWMAGLAITSGFSNVAVGTFALRSNTTGASNTAVGYEALKVSTAANNTALGFQCLDANTTGAGNTAVGHQALGSNTTGGNSVAVGGDALGSAAAVTQSIGIGAFAGRTATGQDSVHIGHSAGYQAAGDATKATTTGARQVNIGSGSGQDSATQRNDTVAIGYRALVDGNDAVALGSGAQALHVGSVALGKSSVTTAANQLMIGDRDIESTRTTGGIILKSPDGTRYKITVANGGTVTVAAA